jgi:translocator protein
MHGKTLGKTAAAVIAAAVTGSLASRPSRSSWYDGLRKPPYNPPRQVFPIVWPLLYADIAAVSADTIDTLRDRGEHDRARAYSIALAVNLILNAKWSWLFFNRHWLGTSAVAAGALAVSSADLSRRAVAARGAPAAPLTLYALWTSFATVLATHIWWLNRR